MIAHVGSLLAAAAFGADKALSVAAPGEAVTDPTSSGSHGVFITVDIAPLDCVSVCSDVLPATGGDVSVVLPTIAALIVLAGVILVAKAARHRKIMPERPSAHYDRG